DTALATAMSLVRTVKYLNMIVVCSGEARLKDAGPFASLVAPWEEKAAAARASQKPLIFALAVRNGQIVQRSISSVGEPIVLPEPPPPVIAAAKAPRRASSTNVAVRTAREPIFMKGPPRQLQPQPAPQANVEPSTTIPATNEPIAATLNSTSAVTAIVAPPSPPQSEVVPTLPEAQKV